MVTASSINFVYCNLMYPIGTVVFQIHSSCCVLRNARSLMASALSTFNIRLSWTIVRKQLLLRDFKVWEQRG